MYYVVGYDSFENTKAALKHNILSFTFFEEDEQIPNIIQEYFHRNTNCSDLIGRSERCLDDKVVNWVHEEGKFKNDESLKEESVINPFTDK